MERLTQLISRLGEYAWWEIVIEVGILWLLIYAVYRFVRGTRAAGALKGLLLILVIATIVVRIVAEQAFPRLGVLYDKFLGIAAIALVVTFQPELRRALIRLGETPFFRSSDPEMPKIVDAVVDACTFLSKNKFGAIIAMERRVGLRETAESGRILDAEVSGPLLCTIFWPSTPLHDMGVIIRGNRIIAAAAQFPLADAAELSDQHLGTRHRAAIGLARSTDALVVVVSEETGAISLAEGTKLERWMTPDVLRKELTFRLSQTSRDNSESDQKRDPANEPEKEEAFSD